MRALVLSGGTGTRLRPLTYSNAKQLIPVANKPILFYIIEKLARAGIKEIGIIVGDTHEEVEARVENGETWNVEITYIHQPKPKGLAHAVITAADYVKDEDFIMILGDNLFQMELTDMIKKFYDTKSNATILLHKVKNPSQFGVAVVQEDKIIKVVEKPREFISDLVITGVYIFDKSILNAIHLIKPSKRGELEITDAIQKLLEEGEKVTYELTNGWWKDTGKLQDVLEANRLILDDMENEFRNDDNSFLNNKEKIFEERNIVFINSVIEGPVVLGKDIYIVDSRIGPYSSVGTAVIINGCEIENSIILEGALLEKVGSKISNSLIGRNATIKNKDLKKSVCLFLGDDSEVYI